MLKIIAERLTERR